MNRKWARRRNKKRERYSSILRENFMVVAEETPSVTTDTSLFSNPRITMVDLATFGKKLLVKEKA